MTIYLKAAAIAVGSVTAFFGVLTAVALVVKYFGLDAGFFYLIIATLILIGAIFYGAVEHLKRLERDRLREQERIERDKRFGVQQAVNL